MSTNMKKLIILISGAIVLAVLSIVMVVKLTETTREKIESYIPENDWEKIQLVKNELEIPMSDAITENLILVTNQRLYDSEILIDWEIPNKEDKLVVTSAGVITRSEDKDYEVTVRANFYTEKSVSQDYKDFTVKILKIPENVEDKLEEAKGRLNLYENNTIDRDILILPRTGAFASKIEWSSSDENIIDLDGNVNQTDKEQTVKMTATIELDNKEITKGFDLTIKPKQNEEFDNITAKDSRILNKVEVVDKKELLVALVNIKAGDAIILADGDYKDVSMEIFTNGTEEHPIFIMAKNQGRATFTGNTQFKIYGDHYIFAGLDFNGTETMSMPTTDKGVIVFEGNSSRLTNSRIINFEEAGYDYKWVSLTGKYHEVDNNYFGDKTTGGSLLTVWRNDNSAQYNKIHHNEFNTYTDSGGANGYETIRIGTSHQSQSDSYTLVENNKFYKTSGEIEIISIKSGRNTIRFNVIEESAGMIAARHGKNNLIEANAFYGKGMDTTGGIRVYDGGHIIRNNYIENILTSSNTRAGIVIHSGINNPGESTIMNAQWTSFNILIENNTIVDSRQSILFGGKFAVPGTDITIKNNLIIAKAGYSAVRHDKILAGNTIYENNKFSSDTAYSAGGELPIDQIPTSAPTGVEFSSDITMPSTNDQGFKLVDGIGASNLTKISGHGPEWL